MAEERKAQQSSDKPSAQDYEFLNVLGQGSFGRVTLAQKKDTQDLVAIKLVEKQHLKKYDKLKEAMNERQMLARLEHPGIIQLYQSFQDSTSLYFVLEYATNGDLSERLKLFGGAFPESLAQFYTAMILNILIYLSSKRIAHRDFKPENLLLTEEGKLKLIDFATAKEYRDTNYLNLDPNFTGDEQEMQFMASSFVGSAEYVSPEILEGREVGPPADLWAFGCIVYQMIEGTPPFSDKTEYLIFQNIRKCKYEFTERFSEEAKDFISKLLKLSPADRVASNGDFSQLQNHAFLGGIEIQNIYENLVPNFQPSFLTPSDPNESFSGDENEPSVYSLESRPSLTDMVHSGRVLKRGAGVMGFIWRQRTLILQAGPPPKLTYFTTKNEKQKGEIVFGKDIQAAKLNSQKFNVITADRKYQFKVVDDTPDEWINKIKSVINT